ncbi:MAG: hypothetical protein VX871_04115, partial [Pseudomonadota bacterium]|nr:hypothetical protein [Pseudomonadota bacterium]
NPYFDTKAAKPTLESTANPAFGEAVMGLNLYVWGVVIFSTVILLVGIVQLFREQFEKSGAEPGWLRSLVGIGSLTLLVMAVLQVLTTFLECGIGDCPNDGGWTWWILG